MLLNQYACSFHCEKLSLSALELSASKRSFADNSRQSRAYTRKSLRQLTLQILAFSFRAYSRKSLRQLTPSWLNSKTARRGHASFSLSLCSFALPTIGSKQTRQQNARRELLSLPWISLTLCRNHVFQQELYQQVQKQLWKQVLQQQLFRIQVQQLTAQHQQLSFKHSICSTSRLRTS